MLIGSSRTLACEACSLSSRFGARRGYKQRNLLVVSLTTDIPGLGIKDDQVVVKAGRMRNELFPNGLARYTNNAGRVIPNTPFGSIILPPSELHRNAMELAKKHEASRAAMHFKPVPTPIESQPLPTADVPTPRRLSEKEIEAHRQAALLNEDTLAANLATIPVLAFPRRVKDTTSGELYGSVSVDDVKTRLRTDHDVRIDAECSFAGDVDRVKTLGRHTLVVQLPTSETEARLTIEVTAE